jgi:ligand-binding SRPBCC domain-containing protein
MPVIQVITRIQAPLEVCFDLARDIDLHMESTKGTDERAVAGITTGLIGMGESVTWNARHFGLTQTLTSRITAFDRPRHFRDSQIEGPFRRFDHDHLFQFENGETMMTDVFDYESPLGWLGQVGDVLFLREYMTRFLVNRGAVVKSVAEGRRNL